MYCPKVCYYHGRYHTCGKTLAVAGNWLDVSAAGPFILGSRPDPLIEASTASGNLSVIVAVLDVGGSAGASPFTSAGGEDS